MDVSVVLPVLNERDNLRALLPRLSSLFQHLHLTYETITVDGGSRDGTREIAVELGARLVDERQRGYAGALATGFAEARGDFILTLDADMSHEPAFVAKMWRARHQADIVIASRYVRGGVAYAAWGRRALSRILNLALRRILSMPVQDMSSGFRLYRREAVQGIEFEGRNFEVLEEILVKSFARGFSVVEVPFTYFPREEGSSHARLIRFGLDLGRSAMKLWWLRNSLDSADYDERAFYSIIPFQRYWQRRRHHIVGSWARAAGHTLDIGCGSSLIIQSLNDAVALEFNFSKVRYLNRHGVPVTHGSAFALPFKNDSFDCVISSQVIEHIPYDEVLFTEMRRVLRPGGMLIIGTPDYDTVGWRTIEPIYGFLMPGGYRDEHITHYTRGQLLELLARHGFAHEETAYICKSELIMRCRKTELPAVTHLRALSAPADGLIRPAEPDTVREPHAT
jgi:glycosyltransferase involved in cell wall biosynthesis/predicted SAM-dependent methyltransferase